MSDTPPDPNKPALERIAGALERMAPAPAHTADWLTAPAYIWDGKTARAVEELHALPLERLRGIEEQKVALRDNCARMSKGAAAHDMLLWGARGMGKSALVRSVCADIQSENAGENAGAIAIVQIGNGALAQLDGLIAKLAQLPRAFVLFCDDLTFDERDMSANLALRSLLDGGVTRRPAHIRLAVTSNHRALAKQDGSDDPGAMHARDERDNFLALADRFGLTLGFHPCDQATYLEMIAGYLGPLGLEFDAKAAQAWAIQRGNRSGRTAFQFATEIAGRSGMAL